MYIILKELKGTEDHIVYRWPHGGTHSFPRSSDGQKQLDFLNKEPQLPIVGTNM